jgi:hypothetical protein
MRTREATSPYSNTTTFGFLRETKIDTNGAEIAEIANQQHQIRPSLIQRMDDPLSSGIFFT